MRTQQGILLALGTGLAGFVLGLTLNLSGDFNDAAGPVRQPSAPAAPHPADVHLRGPAVNNDGDTFRLRMEEEFKIRLWGVDAAESEQTCVQNRREIACGEMARKALADMIGGHEVGCRLKPSATFNRFAAICFAGGIELNREMVRRGWAVDEPEFSKGHYAADQQYAKDNELGLWAMKFENPAHWRACRKPLRKGKERPADCRL